jgi:hypothetical protein
MLLAGGRGTSRRFRACTVADLCARWALLLSTWCAADLHRLLAYVRQLRVALACSSGRTGYATPTTSRTGTRVSDKLDGAARSPIYTAVAVVHATPDHLGCCDAVPSAIAIIGRSTASNPPGWLHSLYGTGFPRYTLSNHRRVWSLHCSDACLAHAAKCVGDSPTNSSPFILKTSL